MNKITRLVLITAALTTFGSTLLATTITSINISKPSPVSFTKTVITKGACIGDFTISMTPPNLTTISYPFINPGINSCPSSLINGPSKAYQFKVMLYNKKNIKITISSNSTPGPTHHQLTVKLSKKFKKLYKTSIVENTINIQQQ